MFSPRKTCLQESHPSSTQANDNQRQMELSLTAAVPVLGLDISASVSLILNRQ